MYDATAAPRAPQGRIDILRSSSVIVREPRGRTRSWWLLCAVGTPNPSNQTVDVIYYALRRLAECFDAYVRLGTLKQTTLRSVSVHRWTSLG